MEPTAREEPARRFGGGQAHDCAGPWSRSEVSPCRCCPCTPPLPLIQCTLLICSKELSPRFEVTCPGDTRSRRSARERTRRQVPGEGGAARAPFVKPGWSGRHLERVEKILQKRGCDQTV